jgi:hypothetical protein
VWGVGCGVWGVGCGVWGVGWDNVRQNLKRGQATDRIPAAAHIWHMAYGIWHMAFWHRTYTHANFEAADHRGEEQDVEGEEGQA